MELQNISNWQLLGTRFQQAMLKNPVIFRINSFFERISIVFSILFGMPYSLSINLLFVIALWIIFVLDGGNIIRSFFHLSNHLAFGFSGGFTIILAQMKILLGIVNGAGTLIFSRESWWARTIAIIIAILAIAFFHVASKLYTKYLEEKRKKEEEHEAHIARQEEIRYVKGKRKGEKLAAE
jgi:uncharacterized membrane protein